ncbi:DUF29 domain-containing protein [Anabaena sp. UHCC 0451]|uniref:DUF29 domain-containing protein n=1 Tax=Anabaena sp. UHCC 0451 TaxID=2055235 RepID=UPI002B1F0A50|nr:DUF29 domain-containing protein [Anabaena sp. UHCC 0451]MEA5578407.1 DUF29 domain-containing protein [Anabaena sp. UHCC 0451]
MTQTSDLYSIYEVDNEKWLEQTLQLLKEKQLDALDLEHLIEELEAMSRRDKLTVESLLEQIIRHLLLLQYWQDENQYNANHWQAEIISFRTQINEYLTKNLQNHLQENQDKVYQKALKYVSKKTGMMIQFPQQCPYTLAQLLDENWLP